MTISLFKRKNAVAKMLSVLRAFGADAHLYIPGPGKLISFGNQLLYSNDLTNSAWIGANATKSFGQLVANSTLTGGFNANQAPVTLSGVVTACGVLKKGTSDFACISLWDGSANGVRRWFNLSSGEIASQAAFGVGWSVVGSSIVPLGDGYYLCVVTSAIAGTAVKITVHPSTLTNLGFACTIGDVGYIQNLCLISGTYTAPQISAFGGIPVTTSVALQPVYASTVINGVTAGNYLDSVGTTLTTVDGLVGLVKDATASINATQATTGNKPILRRGLVNLITYSNTFSNAAWNNWLVASTDSYTRVAPDGTNTAVEFTVSGSGQGKYNNTASVVAGVTYTSAAWMKKVSANLQLVVASSGTYGGAGGDRYVNIDGATGALLSKHADVISYSVYNGGNGWYLITGTFTPTTSTTCPVAVYAQTAGSVQAWTAGLLAGTLTAEQILAQGGIPVTTTAAASNQNAGAYSWEADATHLLNITIPAGYESSTIIDVPATGQIVSNAQNIVGTYPINSTTYGRVVLKTQPSAANLATIKAGLKIITGIA